ncbi:MAG: TetR family transcriptional regulator [Candidatus Sericytochromatia bacterium]
MTMSHLNESPSPLKQTRMRSPAAKAARREVLLEAGRKLFLSQNYAEIRVQDIVKASGLAKGTFYLYFQTKEALFLGVLLAEMQAWILDLADALEQAVRVAPKESEKGNLMPAPLAQIVVVSLSERLLFRRLLALLHPVIEENLDAETALAFKETLAGLLAPLSGQLENGFGDFAPGDGLRFLLALNALVIGLEQMSRPTPQMEAILAAPHLAPLKVNFESELTFLLTRLLAGWNAGDVDNG